MKNGIDSSTVKQEGNEVIYLAGGCFWGIEKLMSGIPGVSEVTSGYANGNTANPTYEVVKRGGTGYKETVRVEYDPSKVDLRTILTAYYEVIDPTLINQQGEDIGTQYQTGIYYNDPSSEAIVKEVTKPIQASTPDFHVEIEPLRNFVEAEEYHQKYLNKHPDGYCHISKEEFDRVAEILAKLSNQNDSNSSK